MVYRELVDYIKKTREQGYSDDLITRGLVARGWAKHDIKAAYELVDQEKFKPLQGDEKKTVSEIVQEKKVVQEQGKMESKGFSTSAAWIRCISAPKIALTNARYFASYWRALKSFVGAYLLEAMLFLLIFYFGSAQLLSRLPANISQPLLALSVPFAAGITLAGIVSWVLLAGLLNFTAWLVAKFLFNGKGSFAQQLYVSSIAFGANFLLFTFVFVLTAASSFFDTPAIPPFYLGEYPVPIITLAAAVISLFALAYAFYMHVFAVKISHEMTSGKALLSILVGIFAMVALVSVVAGPFFTELVGSSIASIGLPNIGLAEATGTLEGSDNSPDIEQVAPQVPTPAEGRVSG